MPPTKATAAKKADTVTDDNKPGPAAQAEKAADTAAVTDPGTEAPPRVVPQNPAPGVPTWALTAKYRVLIEQRNDRGIFAHKRVEGPFDSHDDAMAYINREMNSAHRMTVALCSPQYVLNEQVVRNIVVADKE